MDKLKNNNARVSAEISSWQQGSPADQDQPNAQIFSVIHPVIKRINNETALSNVTQALCYRAQQNAALVNGRV